MALINTPRVRVCALLACLVPAVPAALALEIVIGQGVERALPLAVVSFSQGNRPDPADVIRNDLRRSGFFQLLELPDMPGQPRSFNEVQFADWRRIGVENLLIGDLRREGSGYRLRYLLLDVYKQTQIVGEGVYADDWRLGAHRISNQVFAALTGRPGIFLDRILFVSDGTPGDAMSYYFDESWSRR